ncbi:MAG: SCP2 sterol-binding domain-containing protein [Bacteroidota bacterium]|nr:SCP2 sterol-binding domain-containing protein [Bacteroidota bacterium]
MTSKEYLLNIQEKIKPSVLEGLSSVFHFKLEGEGGGDVTIKLENGNLSVLEGLSGEPTCVIRAKDENFKKLLKGELNPMMAILTGKLKISNQSEMIKFAKLLGWM